MWVLVLHDMQHKMLLFCGATDSSNPYLLFESVTKNFKRICGIILLIVSDITPPAHRVSTKRACSHHDPVPFPCGSGVQSGVTSNDHPDMAFTLRLTHTEATFEQPTQQWEFVSDFAVS